MSRTSQLVVVATDSEQEAVDSLINQLDKPTRQVLIETKLVQISSNPTTKKGVDWSGTLAAQNVSFGNGLTDPANVRQRPFTSGLAPTTLPTGPVQFSETRFDHHSGRWRSVVEYGQRLHPGGRVPERRWRACRALLPECIL